MPLILRAQTPRARKSHRCDWCGAVIYPGEVYARSAWKESGTAYTWKAHRLCDHLADEFCGDYPGDGLTRDDWWCALDERWADLPDLLAGAYSPNHPTMQRLRQLMVEAWLPNAPLTRGEAAQRLYYLGRWWPCLRGELIPHPSTTLDGARP